MPDKVWSDYTIEELQQAALDGTLTSIPYEPQEPWCDGLENYTPLTEERMNRMELGIQRANDAWDSKSQVVLPPVGFSVGAGSWARVEVPTELPADALWVVESMETGRPAAFALATYAREGSKLVVYILNVRDYAANGSLQVTLLRLR